MKLLLTSNGLQNQLIANALFDLTGKRPEDTALVFVPTASNVEKGDKSWLINDLINIKKQNFKSVEITDISAVAESIWKPSILRADVLFFAGGNTYHLMKWLNQTKLNELIPQLLKNKVYVGVSAGSIVTNPDLALKLSQQIYGEDMQETEAMAGLNLVNLYFLPHLNSPFFPKLRRDNIEKVAPGLNRPVYALDDESALKISDGHVEVISQGEWFELNANRNNQPLH